MHALLNASTREVAPSVAPRHVLYLFDQFQNLNAGAERALLKLVRCLPADRYRASIVTFWEPPDASFLSEFGCPVHIFPFYSAVGWDSLRAARQLNRLIREQEVDIVQTMFHTADLWGSVVARLSGVRVILSSRRDMGFLRKRKHEVGYRLLRSLFTRVHTVSDAVRDVAIRSDRLPPAKVITIPNGVDTDRINRTEDRAALRAKFDIPLQATVVIAVGSIKPVKGYEALVETARTVCRERRDVVFVVAGAPLDAKYQGELNAQVEAAGLCQQFRFLGRHDNVFPLLQMSDVFCHMSVTDGLSNALLEAMAVGLPSVVTRVGGNPEVAEEGRTSFIIEPNDPKAAAERLLLLIDQPALSRAMGARARQLIDQNFTAEIMCQRFVSLYDDMLSESSRKER